MTNDEVMQLVRQSIHNAKRQQPQTLDEFECYLRLAVSQELREKNVKRILEKK